MQPLRLLHFADVHLGVTKGGRRSATSGLNQRVDDVCARLDEVCEAVESERVHAVLFAGDAFANQRPDPTLQSLFAARLRRMARAGAAVLLVVGNHDLPKTSGQLHPFSIYEALEVDGVVVADRADVYRLGLGASAPVGELQVAALPHFSRQDALARLTDSSPDPDEIIADELARAVRRLREAVDPSRPSVFVGHCHVVQADLGEAPMLFGASEIEVSLSTLVSGQPFSYFALGHVHRRQILATDPWVTYSGSLERVDFGEGERAEVGPDGSVRRREPEPKGFYRVDLRPSADQWVVDGEPEFREVGARPFVTLRVGALEAADPAADLGRRIEAVRTSGVPLEGAFVRVVGAITDTTDRRRLTAADLRALLPEAYHHEVEIQTQTAAAVRDPRFARAMSEHEALDRYLETRDDWAEDREELARLGRALMAEVLG